MSKIFLLLFLFGSLVLSGQKIYDIALSQKILEPKNVDSAATEYLLFIHSSHRCGYCRLLRRDMASQSLPDNLRIIFMEYDTPGEWILEADSSYLGQEVRQVKVSGEDQKVKIFPTAQLVRAADSSVVKKYKAYPYDFWKDVKKRAGR